MKGVRGRNVELGQVHVERTGNFALRVNEECSDPNSFGGLERPANAVHDERFAQALALLAGIYTDSSEEDCRNRVAG